jgi:hypothetical protein
MFQDANARESAGCEESASRNSSAES